MDVFQASQNQICDTLASLNATVNSIVAALPKSFQKQTTSQPEITFDPTNYYTNPLRHRE